MPSAGIVAVLVSVALGAVLYYLIGNSEEEPPLNAGGRSNGGYRNVRTMPNRGIRNRSTTMESGIRSKECTICLESVATATRVVLEPCNHIFHEKCIRDWKAVANQQSCPNCRSRFI